MHVLPRIEQCAFDDDGDQACTRPGCMPLPLFPESGAARGDGQKLSLVAAHPAFPLHDQEELRRNCLVITDPPVRPEVHANNACLSGELRNAGDDQIGAAKAAL